MNLLKILILKHKLKKYNKDAKYYRNNKSIGYSNWYDTIRIRELEHRIFELENPKQHTFVYCPNCNNELSSSGSFISDTKIGVEYICSKCDNKTLWYFETPCPILLKVDDKIYDKIDYDIEKALSRN